jgi:hypothetical protein
LVSERAKVSAPPNRNDGRKERNDL